MVCAAKCWSGLRPRACREWPAMAAMRETGARSGQTPVHPWLTRFTKHVWLVLTSGGHVQVVELAAQHPQIIPNFGLHPW